MKGNSSRPSRIRRRKRLSNIFVCVSFLFFGHQSASATEIFSNGFESGDIEAWSRAEGWDCELMLNQVPDCDFDLGIEAWVVSPSDTIIYIVNDDSDGDPNGQAIELVVDGPSTMALCFPTTFTETVFMNGEVDARVVSGSVHNCYATSREYTTPDCSSDHAGGTSFIGLESTSWLTYWMGGSLVYDDVSSMKIILQCSGNGVVRYDNLAWRP